ncbi:MAG TPA: ATP-binding protein [Xanthobacteraceae bacterium]
MKPGPWSQRAVIYLPDPDEAASAAALITQEGYFANTCESIAHLIDEVERGAGLAVISDDAFKSADIGRLVDWLNAQPSWSDFATVLLVAPDSVSEHNPELDRYRRLLGNVMFIEHPFPAATLLSIVGGAVRARRRQYQTRAIFENLTASEGLLQTALNAGRLGALELHLPEMRLEVSDPCKAFFGRDAIEPFTVEDWRASVHPEDRDRRQIELDLTLKYGRDYNVEYRIIWPDGSVHWIETRARIVRGPDGNAKSLVGVALDITARKTAEIEREALLSQLAAERTALAELSATLEQRVEERTSDLMKEIAARENAQEQLRQAQKMETIGQLTGGVAHDFNNLLMAVMGNLELLRKRVPEDPRLLRLIDGALQGAERGASLTQRLLAFARQQDLNPTPVDLAGLIRDMIELLERSLGARIVLRLKLPADLPPARIDSNQLELAILNLVINARDAMPDGGVIDIKVAKQRVSGHAALTPGRYLKLSIVDNGGGMSPEVLQKAIEPFFSTKPLGKGTGLGLSMVHGLAVQLGGALDMSSKIGKGTKVDLWLPVATDVPAHVVPKQVPIKVIRSAVILFVDDDPLIAMSTYEMLEDLGHRVIGANSGLHALDILRSDEPIDLLLTDHIMPGMTGIELAMASREVRPQLPVLLATGYADLPEGAQIDVPRLTKPYHQDQLRDRLEQMLGQNLVA